MEKNDPKKGKPSTEEGGRPNREDSGRNSNASFAPFAKDKRKRITRVEKTEPRRRDDSETPERPYRSEGQPKPYRKEGGPPERPYRREEPQRKPFSGGNERRSYNPNFTKDNRLKDDGRSEKRDYNRTDRDFNRSDDRFNSDRPERKPFNRDYNRQDSERKPYRDFNRYDGGGRPEKDFNRQDYDGRPRRDFNKQDSDRPRKDFNRDGKKPYGGQKAGYNKEGSPKGYGGSKPPRGDRAERRPRLPGNGRYSDGSYPTFPAPAIEDEMRLNRYIAAAGMSSRREADELIKSGRITVNGDVVTEMGSKIKPGDIVQLDGETIRSEKKVYILMNKPKGFVTTLEDPHADKTVMDLLKNGCSERVYPVGRLDKNSLGVLLITNDGDMTTQLTHPSYNKKKIYQVTLNKALTKADMQQIMDGVTLEDGEISADDISYVDNNKKEVGIEIHSGRNRIVRRIFEHLGYKVMKLDRVYFAGLTKKNLKRGQWRFLTPKEVDLLRSGRYE